MILTGSKIIEEVRNGRITIDPFVEKNVSTNSYDFHVGDLIKTYKSQLLDPKLIQEVETHEIADEGFIMHPNKVYLGSTFEIMGSNHYVPIIRGTSSIGRLGLFINITADLIDIGSINRWTLQFNASQSIRIYKRMKIGQVTFWTIKGDITLYKGKYKGTMEPQESLIYKDFEDKEHKK